MKNIHSKCAIRKRQSKQAVGHQRDDELEQSRVTVQIHISLLNHVHKFAFIAIFNQNESWRCYISPSSYVHYYTY